MEKAWLNRFFEVIDAAAASPEWGSLKKISLAAKCGPNYLQQIKTTGREPGTDRLMSVLEVLGDAPTFYVLTGLRASREDLEFIRLVLKLDDGKREEAMRFFRLLQADAGKPTPSVDPPR